MSQVSPELLRFDLPPEIDTPYPCIAIGDLYEVSDSLGVPLSPDATATLEGELQAFKQTIAPVEEASFYYLSAADLSAALEALAEAETRRTDTSVGVVQLDKYIGADSDNPAFFRLNISRNSKDEIVSRVDTAATVDEQMAALAEWAKDGGYAELVLCDDVLAFGSTLPPLVEKLRQQLPAVNFRVLAGIAATGGEWRGIENVKEKTGIDAEYLIKVHASPAIENGTLGMSIPVSRDLTIFGGKAGTHSDGTRVSYPYFLPFSKPMRSLFHADTRVSGSEQLMTFSETFVASLETQLGRPLTIGDLIDNGYGVPHSVLECLDGKMELPGRETTLADYLAYARGIMGQYAQEIAAEIADQPAKAPIEEAAGNAALQNTGVVL